MSTPEVKKVAIPCKGCTSDCVLIILDDEQRIEVYGNRCARGEKIGKEKYNDLKDQPLDAKVRVKDKFKKLPVTSDIPLSHEQRVLIQKELLHHLFECPIQRGQVLLVNVLDTGANVIAAKEIR